MVALMWGTNLSSLSPSGASTCYRCESLKKKTIYEKELMPLYCDYDSTVRIWETPHSLELVCYSGF